MSPIVCASNLDCNTTHTSPDFKKTTPLHTACKSGASGVVRLLLTAGADATMRDRNGNTAMMAAVSRGQRAVANTLASFRAPVGIPNNFLHTPYHMACARGDVELAQLLRVSGARRIVTAETAFPGDKAEVLRVSVGALAWGRGVANQIIKRVSSACLCRLMVHRLSVTHPPTHALAVC